MSEALADMLPATADGAQIGVDAGDRAASILAEARPARLWLIDRWSCVDSAGNPTQAGNDYRRVLRRFAAEVELGRVRIVRGGLDIADGAIADASLDFAHLVAADGFDAAAASLDFAWRKTRPEGVVLVEDRHGGGWWTGSAIHAVAAFAGRHGVEIEKRGPARILLRKPGPAVSPERR